MTTAELLARLGSPAGGGAEPSGSGAILGAPIMSFEDLVARLSEDLLPDRPVDHGLRLVAARGLLERASRAYQTPGWASALADLMAACAGRVGPVRARGAPPRGGVLEILWPLALEYVHRLAERDRCEEIQVPARLAEALRAGRPPWFEALDRLALDVRPPGGRWPAGARALLEELGRSTEVVLVERPRLGPVERERFEVEFRADEAPAIAAWVAREVPAGRVGVVATDHRFRAELIAALRAQGVACATPPLRRMSETPLWQACEQTAAAIAPEAGRNGAQAREWAAAFVEALGAAGAVRAAFSPPLDDSAAPLGWSRHGAGWEAAAADVRAWRTLVRLVEAVAEAHVLLGRRNCPFSAWWADLSMLAADRWLTEDWERDAGLAVSGPLVYVLDPDGAFGLHFDALVLPRTEAGAWSEANAWAGFSPRDLVWLDGQGVERAEPASPRQLFADLVALCSGRLLVTRARQTDDGQPLAPSFLWDQSECVSRPSPAPALPVRPPASLQLPPSPAWSELRHAVAARRHRAGWDAWDGLLAAPDVAGSAASAPTWSVSDLVEYARCPFRYFAGRLLGLAEVKESDGAVPRAEFGELLHRVLTVVTSRFREKPLTEWPRALVLDDAESITRAAFREAMQAHPEAVPAFWEGEADRAARMVRRLLASEMDRAAEWPVAWAPTHAEWRFGDDGQVRLGRVAVRGTVDRIDLAPDGRLATIIDYKIHGAPSRAEVDELIEMQLPLYLWAVRESLGAEMVGAGYLLAKSGRRTGGVWRSDLSDQVGAQRHGRQLDEHALDDFLRRVADRVEEVAARASSGDFRPDPPRCLSWCGYRPVCRYDRARVARKNGLPGGGET